MNAQGSAKTQEHGSAGEQGGRAQTTGQGSARDQSGKSQTTGQGSARDESGRSQGSPRDRNAQGNRSETTGQGAGRPETGSGNVQGQGNTSGAGREGAATEGSRSAGSGITTEQRTRIRESVLRERDLPRVGHVDFALSAGTVVPRTVHLARVPTNIVEIYPAWRDYDYFVVGEEIIVVDPRDHRIVEVIT